MLQHSGRLEYELVLPFSPLFYGNGNATEAALGAGTVMADTFSPLFYGNGNATPVTGKIEKLPFTLSVPYFTGMVMLPGPVLSAFRYEVSFSPLFYGNGNATRHCFYNLPVGIYLSVPYFTGMVMLQLPLPRLESWFYFFQSPILREW